MVLGEPLAQRTIFGWVLSGTINAEESHQTIQSYHCILDHNLVELISRFWTQEELPPFNTSHLNKEKEECENHFIATHTRDANGRYKVRLPFKSDPKQLGDSKAKALATLSKLRKRFRSNPTFEIQYLEFLKEYLNLGHMVAIHSNEKSSSPVFYLPHHGVLREASSATRLRVVFNDSSPSSNGLSINHLLHTGAKLQIYRIFFFGLGHITSYSLQI